MGLEFLKDESKVLVKYSPSFGAEKICARLGIEFDSDGRMTRYSEENLPSRISENRSLFDNGLSVQIKHVFHFTQADLIDCESSEETFVFHLGTREGDGCFYRIEGRILGIPQDVLIGSDIDVDIDFFAAGYEKRTSIFKTLSKMLDPAEPSISIGTQDECSIPADEYLDLVHRFPTTVCLRHYGEKIIESYLQDYVAFKKDYAGVYEKALSRQPRNGIRPGASLSLQSIDKLRLDALQEANEMLKAMIDQGEVIPENQWQEQLIGILPLLFPRYVAVISKAVIRDVICNKDREIDYLLIDASGNVDIIEIKKAFEKRHLLMKKKYRDNYIPARELRGGIVQIEKYIYYLLNWGAEGEDVLSKRYADRLPNELKIKFMKPRGLLIMGHCELDEEERRDFDLIRRQYSNVTDIITYDDLLNRLERMMQSVKRGGMRLDLP